MVGFSGGNKYFFPGVAGPDVIDFSHWLGALITSADMIGSRGITPVRALINEAASLIPSRRLALCLVAQSGTGALHAASFGSPESAWAACAEVSAQTHVRYLDAPVRRVLSVIPTKYEDMWTGAKGFYKVEPVVADGGQVIIYAPHITEVSVMHPVIQEIGYHCRDYFLGQWDTFSGYHWGDLAHSTHLRGAGTWDAENGERGRVTVTLATGIPEDVVRAINLDYLDPADRRHRGVRGRPGHAGAAAGRGGAVPVALMRRRADRRRGRVPRTRALPRSRVDRERPLPAAGFRGIDARRAVDSRTTRRIGSTTGSVARGRAPPIMATRFRTAVMPCMRRGDAIGGQRRRHQFRREDVVEADDADVLGYPDTHRDQFPDDADGHQVVVGDDRRVRLLDQLRDRGRAAGDGRRVGPDPAAVQLQFQGRFAQRPPAHAVRP